MGFSLSLSICPSLALTQMHPVNQNIGNIQNEIKSNKHSGKGY